MELTSYFQLTGLLSSQRHAGIAQCQHSLWMNAEGIHRVPSKSLLRPPRALGTVQNKEIQGVEPSAGTERVIYLGR